MERFQIVGLLCHHNIWFSLSSGGHSQGRVHSGQSSDQYHRQPHRTWNTSKFDFYHSKVQSLDPQRCLSFLHCSVLQIDGLVFYAGLKRKNQSECKSGTLILNFSLNFMLKWFRFVLFQQIRVPSEYLTLLSEQPIKNNQLTSDYWNGEYQQ